jgi:hypothetical protein
VLRQPSRVRATLCALFVAACSLSTAAAEIQKPEPAKGNVPKLIAAVSGSPKAGAQTLSRIFASWKARQERVKSFHFSWNSKVAWPKDYAFPAYPDIPIVGGLKVRSDLTSDQGVEFTIPQSEFWVDGKDRIRDEFFEVEFAGPKDWKQTARIRNIVDGTRISRLTMPIVAGAAPELSIWGVASLKDLAAYSWQLSLRWPPRSDPRVVDWAPLRLAFRPLDPALGWSSIEHCRVVGEDVLENGLRCVKVRMDARDLSEMCWVDPNRDDIIVRWEKRKARSAQVSVTIEYRRDKVHRWIPSRWVHHLPGTDSEISGSVESTVTDYAINEKFPVDTFQCLVPFGTRVCDVTAEGLISADKNPTGSAKELGSAIPSLETIAAAWTKRQEKTKSLKFTWREERASSRGLATQESHTVLIDGDRFAYVEDNDPYPQDMASLVIASEQASNAPHKGSRPQSFIPELRPARWTFDGRSTRTYRRLPDSKITGIGRIGVGFHIQEVERFALEPVLLAFRPFDVYLGRIKPSDFRVSPNRGKIGDVSCVILETTDAESRGETFYWLDPARDYIVLRRQQTTNGTDSERMDISYRHDPAAGWTPEGCKRSTVSLLGRRWRSETATITAFTANQPIPAAEFLVEFPKGTKVHELPKEPPATGIVLRFSRGTQRTVARPKPSREPDPDPIFKPLFDPFADSVADVQAALKTAKSRNKRVLVVFGDNSVPDSLNLCNILIGNADVAPVIKKGFVLVLVDLYTDAGGRAEETFFDVSHRITLPHVGVLDSNGELLQFQLLNWLHSEEGNRDYDGNRIKQLLGYWVK